MTTKPREFWIKFAGAKDVIYTKKPDMSPGQWGDYPDSNCIHVREVIDHDPLDAKLDMLLSMDEKDRF